MKLAEYFTKKKGHGILATTDSDCKPNLAVYSRPHVMEDGSIAFIMLDRLSHANVKANPRAAYLFIEKREGKMRGVRLYLSMLREEKNSELLQSLRRVKYPGDEKTTRYLVFFKIDKVLPLLSGGETPFKY